MKTLSTRSQRVALLLGMFVVSFALYAAAESGAGQVELVLLGLLASLMVAAMLVD